jgi:tetratricopeptide (TPR) repeat protein
MESLHPAGRSVFVGRESELAVLRAAVEDAIAGRGRCVLVSGEPGIGKTSTCDQLATCARGSGAHVVWGRCYEGEGAPAFWPWLQVLRACTDRVDPQTLRHALGAGVADIVQLVPELRDRVPDVPAAGGLDSAQGRFRLFDSIARFLDTLGRSAPLAIIIDDLHGADEPSLLLLRFVARALHGMRVLMVGAYRDVGLPPAHPFTDTFVELLRVSGTERLALSGLNEAEVGRFIELSAGLKSTPMLVTALHRQTEGNPLFLKECVQVLLAEGRLVAAEEVQPNLAMPIPESVKAVIDRRLAPLSAACHEVLSAASVMGREFRFEGLATQRTAEAGAVAEAVAARIIVPVPEARGRYRFAHALIAETLYEQLSPACRTQLHRQVGEALERLVDADEHLAELAYHFFKAGSTADSEKAAGYAQRAGDRAMTILAYEEAARLYQMSMDALDRAAVVDTRQRCDLLLALGQAYQRAGNTPANKAVVLRAAELARTLGDANTLARAALTYGVPFAFGEGPDIDDTLVGLLNTALAAVGSEATAVRVQLLSRLATAVQFSESRCQQEQLSAEALEVARCLGRADVLAHALEVRHTALWDLSRGAERLAIASELIAIGGRMGDSQLLFRGHCWRAHDRLELGDPEGFADIDVCVHLAAELKQPLYQWQAMLMRSARPFLDGRWAEAAQYSEEALQIGRATLRGAAFMYWLQASVTQPTGERFDELVRFMRHAADNYPAIPAFQNVLAYLYAKNGRLPEAAVEFDRAATGGFENLPRDVNWSYAMAMSATACAVLRDRRHAAALYRILAPHRAGSVIVPGVVRYMGPVSHFLGMLASVSENWAAAAEHFEVALDLTRRLGARPQLARTQYEYARMLLARDHGGDREQAQTLLEAAQATARELGMPLLMERVQALHDGAPPPTERDGTDGAAAGAAAESLDDGQRPPSGDGVPEVCVFHRTNAVWTITLGGKTVVLKHGRGLDYLAWLFAHPGREFHVSEMIDRTVPPPASVAAAQRAAVRHEADVGGGADPQATAQYRQRLAAARAELAEAESGNDLGRAERLREEIDYLTTELVGVARGRRAGVNAERARVAVGKRVRATLHQIEAVHPVLGRRLRAAVRTGYFCCYAPDPELHVECDP